MKKTLFLVASGFTAVTCQRSVSGYNNATTTININGTTFSIYSSNFPVDYSWIPVQNFCNPVTGDSRGNASTCSYLGTNYCCGTWNVDPWYQQDITKRLTASAWNNAWYATSYFNQYSGYHCQLNPELYNSLPTTISQTVVTPAKAG